MVPDLSGLVLRPWRVEEAELLFDLHHDPLMRTQAQFDDLDGARAWIAWVDGLDNGHAFAIADAADRPWGSIGVTNIDRNANGWTWYATHAEVRGMGVATDALCGIAAWAHAQGLHRLELGHRLNNPASCKVATRAGFIAEGVRREKLLQDGQRHDTEEHARLATDPLPEPGRPVIVRP
ncbi:GNAT family N-acetyltransferase [Phytomonospora endophytica]|uniref:RimJ/RimL family protein N-acetyltransferase n=1 Tax=Phytomonospora endophytica TaxID=714109 RepID=A0A841FP03_9ACTN|nr:GNAT family N-acetyltransferase [Phytomonospora endophytica]MBB6034957.1 RimJ/RimL family protein N-acetyltransferase [Phytomonospora endophytica]GIG70659.1 acetyltransferase [Phytomonospora endophytica]